MPVMTSRHAGGGRTFYPSSENSRIRDNSYHHHNSNSRGNHSRDFPPRGRSDRGRNSNYSQRSSGGGHPMSPPTYGGRGGRDVPPTEFSNYYRDRFGSHSPEEYKNLRLSHIDPAILNNDLRRILENEFSRYGEMEVKIVAAPQGAPAEQRLAYVNYNRPEIARRARKQSLPKLAPKIGRHLKVDPAGVIRDQGGRFLEGSGGRGGGGYDGGRPPMRRSVSPGSYYPPRHDDYRDSNADYRGRGSPDRGTVPSDFHRSASSGGGRRGRSPSPMGHHYGSRRSPHERNGGHHPGRPHSRGSGGGHRPPSSHSSSHRRGAASPVSGFERWKEAEAPKSTRVLYVGNLPGGVRRTDLEAAFERYGVIEDVDIKPPHEHSGNSFAFVQFQDLYMALKAKYHVDGQHIAGNQSCKIGYGKPPKTAKLWIGGLGPWTSVDQLEKEFDRYGAIDKTTYVQGDSFAYVTFASLDAAADACAGMRGFPLGGPDRKILVDFASDRTEPDRATRSSSQRKRSSPSPPPREKRSSRSKASTPPPSRGRRGPRTPPSSPPPSPKRTRLRSTDSIGRDKLDVDRKRDKAPEPAAHLTATNLTELESVNSPCWTGALVLKKSSYPIRLYNLQGDDDLIDQLLRDEKRESMKLHVTQRLPFGQANEADFNRYLTLAPTQAAFLLAAPNPNATAADLRLADAPTRPLKAFVQYLAGKAAAGVVSLSVSSSLYAFPRCELSETLCRKLAPQMTVINNCPDDCLLVVLVRSPAKNTP